jgi:hypothetical protein
MITPDVNNAVKIGFGQELALLKPFPKISEYKMGLKKKQKFL